MKPFVELVKKELAAEFSFEQAVRVGLTAILVSPDFLSLREKPGKLDDFALAARLSYFLWSTMPDAELLALAEKGRLSQPEALRGQVERMLKHPKAAAFAENFAGQWLGLREIDATEPSHLIYPEFDHMFKVSMIREAELFFAEVLKDDLSLTNFAASDFTIGDSAVESICQAVHRGPARLGRGAEAPPPRRPEHSRLRPRAGEGRSVHGGFPRPREARRVLRRRARIGTATRAIRGVGEEAETEGGRQAAPERRERDLIAKTRVWFDLIHLALQTDSSRLVTLQLLGTSGVPPVPGVSLGHHDLSHHGKDPTKIEQLKKLEAEKMKTLRDFLKLLEATKEDGETLLDRTTVFFGSNLADASTHGVKNMPVLLAGGGFKHGRHLAFDPKNNPPLCNLYVSMLRRLGLEADKFGSSTGALTKLET